MGRKSAVDKLPPDAREHVREQLADGAASLDEVKASLAAEHPDAPPIGTTSLWREQQKIKAWAERAKRADAVVKAWLDAGGQRPEGQLGKLLQETLRMLAFQATDAMSADAETDGIDIKAFGILSRSYLAIENAARISAEREQQLKEQGAKEALDKAEAAAKAAPGEDREAMLRAVQRIRGEIYGGA